MRLLLLREDDAAPTADGRTIVARICTYDRVYRVGRERERVRPGAFKSPLARPSGVLRYRHIGERPNDRDDPEYVYGAVRVLREEGGALVAEAEVVEGSRGDHLLALVRDGAMTGVSMSALVGESTVSAGGLRDITAVKAFYGFSITPNPGYDDAGVTALRDDAPAPDAARLAAARAELARFRADMARYGKPGR